MSKPPSALAMLQSIAEQAVDLQQHAALFDADEVFDSTEALRRADYLLTSLSDLVADGDL